MNAYRFAPNAQAWVDPLGLARICKRPLNAPILRSFNTHKALSRNPNNLGAYHEHIIFDDGDNVGYTDGIGIFKETDPKLLSQYKCGNTHYDDTRMRAAVEKARQQEVLKVIRTGEYNNNLEAIYKSVRVPKYAASEYSTLTNNCQSFISDVLKRY